MTERDETPVLVWTCQACGREFTVPVAYKRHVRRCRDRGLRVVRRVVSDGEAVTVSVGSIPSADIIQHL